MTDSTKPVSEAFISYSQDSIEHMERVLKLSDRLRAEGVDCDIDQYEVDPPEGWPRWMDRKIRESKHVLLICTERYLSRVNGTEKEGTGFGVRWEGNLIYQHIYDQGTINNKFIPVMFDPSDEQFIPTPMRGATRYCLATERGYEDLYRRLTNQPRTAKPELGKRVSLSAKPVNPRMYVHNPIDVDLWNAARWHATVFFTHEDVPPVLAIAFLNEEAARKIFEQWREWLGDTDTQELIRISIIEGRLDSEDDLGYSVHIGPDLDSAIERLSKHGHEVTNEDLQVFISRIHRMYPKAETNHLGTFKQHVQKHKSYALIPALISKDASTLTPFFELGIGKKKIVFRNVADIKDNDIDAVIFGAPNGH